MTNFTQENIDRFVSAMQTKAKERHESNVVRAYHKPNPFGGKEVVVELIDNNSVHDYFALFQNPVDGKADFVRVVG